MKKNQIKEKKFKASDFEKALEETYNIRFVDATPGVSPILITIQKPVKKKRSTR